MKCPENMRVCPEGWNDCGLCANFNLCINGMYEPKEEVSDIDIVIKVAEISAKAVNAEVVKNVREIRGDWFSKFNQMTEEERWQEHGKYPVPNIHAKEVIPLDGPSAPGGGSKNKAKKSATGNKVFTDVWSGF